MIKKYINKLKSPKGVDVIPYWIYIWIKGVDINKLFFILTQSTLSTFSFLPTIKPSIKKLKELNFPQALNKYFTDNLYTKKQGNKSFLLSCDSNSDKNE